MRTNTEFRHLCVSVSQIFTNIDCLILRTCNPQKWNFSGEMKNFYKTILKTCNSQNWNFSGKTKNVRRAPYYSLCVRFKLKSDMYLWNTHSIANIFVIEHRKILNSACRCLRLRGVYTVFILLWDTSFLWDNFCTENEFCLIKVLSHPMKNLINHLNHL